MGSKTTNKRNKFNINYYYTMFHAIISIVHNVGKRRCEQKMVRWLLFSGSVYILALK